MTAAAGLVHGLDGAPARAAFAPLSVAELAPVLACYPGLGAVRGVSWHSPRPFAASGIVACDGGPVFVKRHDARVRTQDDLREEHRFIAHLRAAGLAVPLLRETACGDSVCAGPGGTYEVHAPAPAALRDLYREAVSWSAFTHAAHGRQAGRALAQLHLAAAGYAAPPRRTGLLVADFRVFGSADPMAALAARLAAEPLLAASLAARPWQQELARHLLPLHARAWPALASQQPLWTHNDWHASNLLWAGEGAAARAAAVMDFGLCNRTCAIFDLATAIERNAIAWLRLSATETDIARPEIAAALLAGYDELSPLGPAARAAVALALPLVHAEFALSELAYFHGILQDAAAAEAAWRYLLDHAAWFAIAHGQHFLALLAG